MEQIDTSLSYDPNYLYFDFENPESLPSHIMGTFDMFVIDPPFITSDVWEKYALTVKRLMRTSNGYILTTTIAENEELMYRLFQATSTIFKPCIPHLVYQYRTYTNFPSSILSMTNKELTAE
jgi:predicted methyltransferase